MVETKNLISVIIPSYNSENHIERCITSVLNQTNKNFEIIIVDNYSDDKTLEIINNLKSNKIRIFNINNKGNISVSRNLGIKMAYGNWIAFLDSDDFWSNDKIEVMEKKFSNYDFLAHKMKIVNQKNKEKKYFSLFLNNKKFKLVENLVLKGNRIFNSSVIVKKKLLKEINYISELEPNYTNDLHTWIRLSLINEKFYYENKELGTYLSHNQSYSHNSKQSKNYIKCVLKFKKNYSKKVKKYILGYYYYLKAIELIKKKEFKNANFYLFKSSILSEREIKIKSFFLLIKNLINII